MTVSRRQRKSQKTVFATARQAPRWRAEKGETIPRSGYVVPARIQHHHARRTESDLCARTNGHLIPFFGAMVLPEVTAGKVNEYRIHRLEESRAARGKPPAHNTMHQEVVTLRQILKTALRTDGSIIYRTCQRHTGRRPRFFIEHGSRRKNTSSFTRQRGYARMIPSSLASAGKRINFTTTFSSQRIQASAQTRR